MEVNLELYLVHLHVGQWFGFNGREKTYENLVILDNQYSKPTEQECLNGIEQMKIDLAMQDLRKKRNSLLAQTDYLALSDQTMSAEMTTYRQELRDITNGLSTVADVEAVKFPERPKA
jgi:hypothetical protein